MGDTADKSNTAGAAGFFLVKTKLEVLEPLSLAPSPPPTVSPSSCKQPECKTVVLNGSEFQDPHLF